MNQVILIGNMTKDPELRYTQAGDAVCNFTIAVQRRYTEKDGTRRADFFDCTVWRKSAEFTKQYGFKGRKIAVVGELANSEYEKDGVKHRKTFINVSGAEFVSARPQEGGGSSRAGEFVEVDDDSLPFDLSGRKEVM